jgi:large-conductance mechanosensitive channel
MDLTVGLIMGEILSTIISSIVTDLLSPLIVLAFGPDSRRESLDSSILIFRASKHVHIP